MCAFFVVKFRVVDK